jgi:FixJ family two-component response regulator
LTAEVFIIDDDGDMLVAIADVLRSIDLPSAAFDSAQAFLNAVPAESAGCILLDVRMPGTDGLELQHQLLSLGYKMPIIFITGYGDIPMTVQAMRAGALDFLTKPFDDDDLFQAVRTALARDAERREREAEQDAVIALSKLLTKREKECMGHVVKGLMNKQIAYEMSLTEITVKLHRASLMKKLKSRTLPDLVRRAEIIHAHWKASPPMEEAERVGRVDEVQAGER